jgi:AcrR family transcriptional regulator
MSPAERRGAIIDATVEVMLERGMAATTVRDVAQQMGTSSGLIHHYFASMDQLLAAAFEQAATEDLEVTRCALAGCEGPMEQLTAFFSTYARAEQEWAFQLWLDAWAEAGRRPDVQATSRRLNVAWQQLLVQTISAGVERRLMSCTDPASAAWRILSLLDGLVLQAVANRVPIERASVIAWSVAHAEHELGLAAGTIL